jgi:septal ring factor EnvC (AmiA/AmiB activator)
MTAVLRKPSHRTERRPRIRPMLAALACAALWLAPQAHAQTQKDPDRQKKQAENERADLRQKLDELKRSIDKTENAKSDAADALAHSEAAISDARRNLHELAAQQQAAEARLQELARQHAALQKTVDTQQKQLADLLRKQYVAGNEDRIKLLLSGDNPNRINRELQYMGYVSRAQAELIESLRANLKAIEDNQAEARTTKEKLDDIANAARKQHASLEKQKAERATLLAQLSTKLSAQRKEAGKIERDEKRLSSLVDKLSAMIAEQRKAEAERKRREQAAKAERERRLAEAKKRSDGGKIANPDAIEDDEPSSKQQPIARNELLPDSGMPDGAFAALRGKLRLPVRGDMLSKFGSKRGDGPVSKGLFIRAPEGAEVRAVAGGRVVFADWLRGFGNLLIIDHGSQYLTIYANNQSLLKRAGDVVKGGDVVANVGNSGGNEQSGLYFEMRHDGRAFDPLDWVTIR